MTQPIDELYVDIHARGEEKAARDVERAVRGMQRDIDTVAKNISISFNDAADELAESISTGANVAERAVDDLADSATRDLRRIEREARDAGESIAKSVGGGAQGAGLLEGLSQLGAHLRNISALAPPPILLALAAAVPAVLALGGAVADLSALLLLLPAAVGSLVAVGATLKLAFTGIGAAVEALASGDLDKINETMKNLAPSARAFAREINRLREPLKQLRKDVQQEFFAPLRGDITRLVNAALPTLRGGLKNVANSLGEFGSALFDLLGSQDILEVIGDVFESTARIIRNITPTLIELLGTLFGIAERGLPFMERAFDALGRGMNSLASFFSEIMQTGEFETFMNDAFQIMSDLGDLTKSLFNLMGALFGDMGDEGSSFIQTLAQMTQQLADFFNSAEGQAVLQRLVDTLPLLAQALAVGVTALLLFGVYTEATIRSLQWLGEKTVEIAKAIGDFFGKIPGWLGTAGSAVGGFFTAIGSFFVSLGTWIGGAYITLQNFIGSILMWFTDLQNIGYAIGFVLGTAVNWFFTLRDKAMGAMNALVGFLAVAFLTIHDNITSTVSGAITAAINFFNLLPSRVATILLQLWNVVTSRFTQIRDGSTSRTRSMVNTVIQFFLGLPGRAAAIFVDMRNRVIAVFTSLNARAHALGKNILMGIVNGLKSQFSFAVDAAKRVARGILDGMKDALGIGSPSKLAAIEVGRPIMQGVGVGAEEGTIDVRHTLADAVRGALPNVTGSGNAGGQVITFSDGAVQVVFQGAVPTEAEALRTGQSVASGIAQTLARRNVRTAVRIA